MTNRRLIEEAFPLKEVSEHSKHEKNVRHGHISTLHIWPARRPLAACRAAIIAALLPDPGDEESRHELNKKIASITKWKTENGPALDYFREEIRKAYGGRAPKVLDMFAGGGAIPLEAMRLGCDVTAIDYNPVAWFILKCTLEFPQRLAGKSWPLPADAPQLLRSLNGNLDDMDEADGDGDDETDISTPMAEASARDPQLSLFAAADEAPAAGNLADHVRYWGAWVLDKARTELASYYPTVDGQPPVAYLWARTVPCPDPKCGCEVPLLKTLWLSNKAEKTLPDTQETRNRADFICIKRTKNTSKVVVNARRALRLIPPTKGEGGRVQFEVWTPGADDQVPDGSMHGANSKCPTCGTPIDGSYIKQSGQTNKMGAQLTSVVVDTGFGKEYRAATNIEAAAAQRAVEDLPFVASQIPHGVPTEKQQKNPRTLVVQLYGLDSWDKLFTSRQLLTLATFVKWTRNVREQMKSDSYAPDLIEAVVGYLALAIDRLADRGSTICTWTVGWDKIRNTFTRFALQITWDFVESVPIADSTGGYSGAIGWIAQYAKHGLHAFREKNALTVDVRQQSATEAIAGCADLIMTDPPYYNAIPYADLADFFYVWLRRTIGDEYPDNFAPPVTLKNDQLALRLPHQDLKDEPSSEWYEQGMEKSFRRAYAALNNDGRFVIVFAHRDPDAWETLTSAMIRAGFTVASSWPIDTEMGNRTRAVSSAALASSIWLVCRKRPADAGIGRYRAVRRAMEERITERLRYFWDIGLSGPDFVWAAIGPALESYSSYVEVKRLDGSSFTVGEFLKEVRRMVADFALGRILHGQSTEGLDEWTRYYLMHRSDFGLEAAPVGECILLSQGYGIDLNELRSDRGYIRKASGSDIRLAKWDERERSDLGELHPSGGLPLVDMLHRLMHLWAAGSLDKLNGYAAERGLRQNDLFWAVAQAILEMADAKSRERTLLEALVAWGRGQTTSTSAPAQPSLLVN